MFANCFYCDKSLKRALSLKNGNYYFCDLCKAEQIHDLINKNKLVKVTFPIEEYMIHIDYEENKSTISYGSTFINIEESLKVTPKTPISKIKTYLLFT